MSTHCPGCVGISYDDEIDGEPAIGPESPPCPGCQDCAAKDADLEATRAVLRRVVRAVSEAMASHVDEHNGIVLIKRCCRDSLVDALALPLVREALKEEA